MTFKAGSDDMADVRDIFIECGLGDWPVEELSRLRADPFHRIYAAGSGEGLTVGALTVQAVLDEAEVLSIGVLPNYRRQGFARSLLSACLADLRKDGVRSLHLEVRECNIPAIEFYRGLGFKETGVRRNYYAKGIDALVMSLELSEANL